MKQYFAVGTYTEPILFGTGEVFVGKGKGISICEFEEGTIRELKELCVGNPSFLTLDEERKKIYAVNERKEFRGEYGGGVTQITYDDAGNMRVEQELPTRGTDPCHIDLSPGKEFLSIANFADGTVTVYSLDGDGNILAPCRIFEHRGESVHPIRQRGPHAHSVIFAPDENLIFVPDLGLDVVKCYRFEKNAIEPDPAHEVVVAPGSGPRFGEFGKGNGHFYLIQEIGSQVTHYRYSGGDMIEGETVGTLPESFREDNICSDLHITPDGRYLYASNRGHDSLVCYRLDESGCMQFAHRQSCGGRTPRNFVIDPTGRYLLVGNQDSDNITVFAIKDDGYLDQVNQIAFGSPVCLRFFKDTVFA